jgi:hypothetical protein
LSLPRKAKPRGGALAALRGLDLDAAHLQPARPGKSSQLELKWLEDMAVEATTYLDRSDDLIRSLRLTFSQASFLTSQPSFLLPRSLSIF